ncbi:hypothetical protein NEISUBOT_05379 [Neisseria subflava NJ9703]|uniref:Uncharacterized protein n=1 Tax=Neisseria subflava NJ9703 TaxID=546268 RepID=A0A9W5IPA5_NEISU|nr:hypothetical protein NEISUBOT_05379 [Neisseria subflava NJ9703]
MIYKPILFFRRPFIYNSFIFSENFKPFRQCKISNFSAVTGNMETKG